MDKNNLQNISNHFISVLEQQLSRLDKIKSSNDWIDYSELKPIVIGMIGGDGIGPIISDATRYVLEELLSEEKNAGKILFKDISFFFYLLEKEKIKYNDIKKIFLSDLKKNDPIKLVNLIGVDTCLHVLINLNKYDNQYYVPKMLEDSVKKSILGNKNKKYFKIL